MYIKSAQLTIKITNLLFSKYFDLEVDRCKNYINPKL